MEFRFESKITAWDMWKLSMHHIYHSMVGLCNAIFAVAIILLTIRFWNPRQEILMGILVLLCVLYPIMQPVMVYLRAKKQVAALPEGMVIVVNETGLHISTEDNQKSHIPWARIRGIIQEPNMLILAADAGRGYMITNKMLGNQKSEFIEYVESNLIHNK